MSGRKMERLIAAGAVLLGSLTLFGCSKYDTAKSDGGNIKIPTATLSDGGARFYKYTNDGKEIRYFVVKTLDGGYRAAFDACDSCYRDKKGYEQQGGVMNCRNCNQKFAIDRLGPNATGGCNPGYLAANVQGDMISISENALKDGTRYF